MKKVTEGHSPHVVGMLGCVTLQEPLCLVTEFVKYGDLLSYLRSSRKIVSRPYTGLGSLMAHAHEIGIQEHSRVLGRGATRL